jgi:hypothetical protein
MSESGILDVFVLPGPRPYDVLRQYTQLTGTQTLPPYWSIAYHQCRWNYFSEDEVAEVDRGFDTHDIPYDVLWLDIEHTDSKKYFTWNQEKFPHPEEMLRNMSARGKRVPFLFCDSDFSSTFIFSFSPFNSIVSMRHTSTSMMFFENLTNNNKSNLNIQIIDSATKFLRLNSSF